MKQAKNYDIILVSMLLLCGELKHTYWDDQNDNQFRVLLFRFLSNLHHEYAHQERRQNQTEPYHWPQCKVFFILLEWRNGSTEIWPRKFWLIEMKDDQMIRSNCWKCGFLKKKSAFKSRKKSNCLFLHVMAYILDSISPRLRCKDVWRWNYTREISHWIR